MPRESSPTPNTVLHEPQVAQQPEPPPDIEGFGVRLGKKLRVLRTAQRLTLAEAAQRIGVSASQLSRVERGQQQLSVVELMTFAHLYGCSVTDFFLTEEVQPVKITRRRDRVRSVRNVTAQGEVLQEHLLNASNVLMEPSLLLVPAGAASGGPITHEGEEFLTVLDGSLRVWVQEKVVDLDQGDTIYYPCTFPHHWANPDGRPAIVLAVSCPPSY